MTWYPREFSNVPMTDMRMRPDPSSGYPGRTYRFYTGKTVYEFGHGLSYSNHSYKFVSSTQNKIIFSPNKAPPSHYMLVSGVGKELCEKVEFNVVVGVENHGQASNHTVLLLAKRDDLDSNKYLIKQLVGYQRVSLGASENGEVEFVVKPCEHFSWANSDGLMVMQEGSHSLVVGDQEYAIDIVIR